MIKNKDYIRQQFDRHIETYNSNACVQKMICKKLVANLLDYSHDSFHKALEIGCGTGLLTQEFLSHIKVDSYIANDIAPSAQKHINKILCGHPDWSFISADAENMPFPNGLDLVLSASTIQWFNDISSFIRHAYEALNENGIFAFSTFGQKNYREIKSVLGQGLDYKSLSELQKLLNKYFQIISATEFEHKLHFESPVQTLKHIKYLGVNGIERQFWSRGQLVNFNNEYNRKFRNNGKGVSLTYHPIIIIAKKI